MVWLLAGLAGCGSAGQSSPEATPEVADQRSTSAPPTDGWRFRPTLDANLPRGAVAEPVLELSEPRARTVLVLAAVLRPEASMVEIESWTYEQIPGQADGLRVREQGGPVLRRSATGPRSPQLAEVRRRLATPRVVLTRPLGLGDDPAAAIAAVSVALRGIDDPTATPRDRVVAAATAIRGIDDPVLLEQDALGRLTAALATVTPEAAEVERASDRRASATWPAAAPSTGLRLDLQRKADGWAITAIGEAPSKPQGPDPG